MEKIKVKAIRANLGMTQSEMAEKLNISISSYVLKEQGKRDFSFAEVKSICDLANIDDMRMIDV